MIHKIIIPTPFAVGDVNAYLIKGDILTLVDAGPKTEQALSALENGICEAGYQLSDIEQVILTHHHPDHSGCIDAFKNAQILGHAYNQVWLEKNHSFLTYHDEFYYKCLVEEGVPEHYLKWIEKMKRPLNYIGNRSLDTILNEGDVIPGHPKLQVLETLGHAQSHISLWEEETGVLIGGDLIIDKISSNPLIEPPLDKNAPRPKSMLQYNESLKRVQALEVHKVFSGHGNEVYDVSELISSRLIKQRERALKVLEMMSNGEKTIFELTQQLFPKVYEKELGLTLSETIGQIDYLLDEGLILEKQTDEGILLYDQA
ncbi:MBL fold metallo-hydrolase [Psychrobacillus sp. Sa2BUA9]|uniref:MBL fold metallo-hydrolase n=1 Tax=Psychrobacillus faecigallinarum TaxID=2762235 RepID=A0ABR8RAC8_9BACI|nr:MBL fold metallo-hydrolase [Psychrobacillus faecigallinarum]MBD7944607.1 MBL fold metallo-hydrolase [Psychrobacillus faecigallinarum]